LYIYKLIIYIIFGYNIMIIITNDNISNYLTDQDINIIDNYINKKIYFMGLNTLIKYKKDKKFKKIKNHFKKFIMIYNHKYYFISYNDNIYNDIIIIINNNNYNDIKIYIKYKSKDKYSIINNDISVFYFFYTNKKIIIYKYKFIEYYFNFNYKLIEIGTKVKKIFLNYYYIYYKNYSSLYYYNNYFLFILKTYKNRNYTRIKSNLNNIIYNLLFFV